MMAGGGGIVAEAEATRFAFVVVEKNRPTKLLLSRMLASSSSDGFDGRCRRRSCRCRCRCRLDDVVADEALAVVAGGGGRGGKMRRAVVVDLLESASEARDDDIMTLRWWGGEVRSADLLRSPMDDGPIIILWCSRSSECCFSLLGLCSVDGSR